MILYKNEEFVGSTLPKHPEGIFLNHFSNTYLVKFVPIEQYRLNELIFFTVKASDIKFPFNISLVNEQKKKLDRSHFLRLLAKSEPVVRSYQTDTITVTVDSSKSGQTIKVHDGGSGSFGLRDLPLSRKPIPIGKMFETDSNLTLTFTIANDTQKIVDQSKSGLSGTNAKIVFIEMSANDGVDGKFKGFGSGDELSFDIVASQAGNNSYHAAQSVSRTVKIKKPSKSVFYDERKADPRYEDVETNALSRISSKLGISGDKAIALFNRDNYDSDGDGVSNLLERAFGGDSLGNDSRSARPAPVKKNDNYEYLSFDRYNSDFQADMGLVYIVEESSNRRTWTSISSPLSTTDLGGGMERVVYRTTSATSAGNTQFIRCG
jgi:hypothetical protein